MKKYITKLLVLFISVIMLQSCSGFLDAETTERLPTKQVKSLSDAEKVVNGFYRQMKWNDYYGTDLIILGENRGDDLRPHRLSGGYEDSYNYEFSPSRTNYNSVWLKGYNIIMNVNVFLNNWEDIPASSKEAILKNNLKGQALAIRALAHFDLVKVFGYPYLKENGASLGVVLGDRVFAVGEQASRSTVKETYEFILKDLTEALLLLSESKTTSPGYFNYWGVKGILARVYLYMGDYKNAFEHADEILTAPDNPYTLITNANYVNSWKVQNSSETMLELKIGPQSGLDNNGGVNSWYYVLWHGLNKDQFAGANLVPTDAWFALIAEDPGDVRGDMIITHYADGHKWLAKFSGNSGEGDFKRNHPMVIRLSEIYLIAAEAALRPPTVNQAKADTYLHAIRERANPAVTRVSATPDLVLKEKRKELIGEGHRYYDLARLGLEVNRDTPDNKLKAGNNYKIVDPWNRRGDQYQVLLPISSNQRTVNPAVAQNPGYPD